MPGALANASAWLASQRARHLARDVTYVTRTGQRVEVKATPTVARTEDSEAGEVMQEGDYVDWVIEASSIDTGAGPCEPQPNDRIFASGRCYRVVRDTGAPAWSWTDAQRVSLRIRTRAET